MSINVPDALQQKIEKLAKLEDVSPSQLVGKAIDFYTACLVEMGESGVEPDVLVTTVLEARQQIIARGLQQWGKELRGADVEAQTRGPVIELGKRTMKGIRKIGDSYSDRG